MTAMQLPFEPQPRPLLYLDVEGVLYGLYDGEQQLRPGVNTFLRRVAGRFDCRWLTCVPPREVAAMLSVLNAMDVAGGFPYASWEHEAGKTSAIDLQSDFYWVEDGPRSDERAALKRAGRLDRLIDCPPAGADALREVWRELLERTGEAPPRRRRRRRLAVGANRAAAHRRGGRRRHGGLAARCNADGVHL